MTDKIAIIDNFTSKEAATLRKAMALAALYSMTTQGGQGEIRNIFFNPRFPKVNYDVINPPQSEEQKQLALKRARDKQERRRLRNIKLFSKAKNRLSG